MEPNDTSDLFLKSSPGIGNITKPRIINEAFSKPEDNAQNFKGVKRESLTTKNAVKFLLEGRLKKKVCRYCLNVASPLSELDQILQIGGTGVLYKISIRDMVASFHPFKVADDPNFPNKICNKCLNNTISSYLFTQQCERSERALRNCFEDMYNKLEKLDPLEPQQKKRGKQKLHPNYNILYTDHEKVINYAEPIINIVNSGSEFLNLNPTDIDKFECPKCWQVLPNLVSLFNHEKTHPKSMYYHCRQCGKSFTKHNFLKKHKKTHLVIKPVEENSNFKCRECGELSAGHKEHLQHIEKHKFQMVMEHLLERNMDKLCTVCFDKNKPLVDLDKMIFLNGGYSEMMGDRTLYNILGSTVPEMNILHNYTGTKICEKCLNHAITAYVFIHQTQYVRNRLKSCISVMLDNLNKIESPDSGNIFVEISQNTIMPIVEQDFDENLLLDEEDIDETTLKVDVLEDEFREPESESEDEKAENMSDLFKDTENEVSGSPLSVESFDPSINQAKNVVKTYEKRSLINGIQPRNEKYNSLNISEFLTFKKKRNPHNRFYSCKFTCPVCSKHFASDYFLKRHVLKHVFKKVECRHCDEVFKSKFFLYEHTKMCHIMKNSNFRSCSMCGRNFTSDKKMKRHLKSHLTKDCQLCNKTFASQQHYDSHMQRHIAKLRLIKQRRAQTCSFCEKECSNDNELSVHVNKVHLQIKPYSCDMCERQFYTEANLCSHKKVHNLFSKESCQFCGKILKCRRDLVVHVRKHIGVMPHACPVCNQAFYSTGRVKIHMKTYHGGTFCCKLCKSTFRTDTGLKHHINRVHNII